MMSSPQNQDSEVDEGAAAVSSREGVQEEAVVTNVSGIDPAYWEPQQFGECLSVQ